MTPTNPNVKETKALEMFKLQVGGFSTKTIASTYGVSTQTVNKYVDWAIQTGLTQKYESEIISDLVPLAIKVYRKQLEGTHNDDGEPLYNGDPNVAKHIIDTLLKLGDRFEQRQQKRDHDVSLAEYVASKSPKSVPGTVINGETLPPTIAASLIAGDPIPTAPNALDQERIIDNLEEFGLSDEDESAFNTPE